MLTEEWARGMESRMVRMETEIRALAPVAMVREMISAVQGDIQTLAFSVKELTESDLELKNLHRALMVDRAEQEKQKHDLEKQVLREQIEALKRRGPIPFIKEKASPVVSITIALLSLLAVVWGFLMWLQQHYK